MAEELLFGNLLVIDVLFGIVKELKGVLLSKVNHRAFKIFKVKFFGFKLHIETRNGHIDKGVFLFGANVHMS